MALPSQGYDLHFHERRANGVRRLGAERVSTVLSETNDDKHLLQLLPEDALEEPLPLTEPEIKVRTPTLFLLWRPQTRGRSEGR